MNDLGSSLPRFHHPLKTNRVIFRHVRSHDQNGVRIQQVAWPVCGSASPEGCAQTGHGGTVSYAGLVTDADHPQAGGEELFD